jgi:hypothetical protein
MFICLGFRSNPEALSRPLANNQTWRTQLYHSESSANGKSGSGIHSNTQLTWEASAKQIADHGC